MATFFDPLSGNLISSPDKIQSSGDLQELINIDDLLDVDTSTTPPTDGQILTWVDANNQWEPNTLDGSNLTFSAGTEALPGIAFNGDPNTGIYSPGADTVGVSTAGSEHLRIDSTGRVGIGTTAPSRNFVLSGSGVTYLKVAENSLGTSTTDGLDLMLDSGANAYLWNRENGTLQFGTNNTERMRIDSSGRLLVGTTTGTAGYGLTVANGDIDIQTSAIGTTTVDGDIGLDANGAGLIQVTEYNLSQVPVVTQHDIGTATNEVPLNGMLGGMAFQDPSSVTIDQLYLAAGIPVASLPSGSVGQIARVTDATTPSIGSTVAGGGAANALCWYNGTNWTVIGV